jgi:hypothetical protein
LNFQLQQHIPKPYVCRQNISEQRFSIIAAEPGGNCAVFLRFKLAKKNEHGMHTFSRFALLCGWEVHEKYQSDKLDKSNFTLSQFGF